MTTWFRGTTGFCFLLIVISIFVVPSHLTATEQYTALTGRDCEFCHKTPWGGPDLTVYGKAFQRGGHRYPIPLEGFRTHSWVKKTVFLLLRYSHIAAGIIWFGTIFYIYFITTPQALAAGLPRPEMILGWVCFIIIGVTGSFLTLDKINAFSPLYRTQFGVILGIKIILYLLLVGISVFVTTVIHQKLKQGSRKQEIKDMDVRFLTHTDLLAYYSGTGHQPTYIAVEDYIYDVSASPSWIGGKHMGQHFGGRDLTNELRAAPHGAEVLDNFRKVGRLWKGKGTTSLSAVRRTFIFKTFVFLARSALVIASLTILCVALWRWL